METLEKDVAVVGASLAGCTAATLLAEAGADVALVERDPRPEAHKVLCTHFIQPSAMPVLERLGVAEDIRAAGALPNINEVYTPAGWVRPRAENGTPLPHGYNLRRSKLDPIMRARAARAPGVELWAGETVDELVRDRSGRVTGLRTRDRDGPRREVRARLVVGADGRVSTVARLAGMRGRVKENGRFGYFAHWRGVRQSGTPGASQLWLLDPDAGFAFPNDDGVTVTGVMPHRDRLPEWKADRERAYAEAMAALPDGPDLSEAERVSPLIGSLATHNVLRPATRPGVALAGDAAMTSDPLWGVGCGFALQSAEWLADALTGALRSHHAVDTALTRYARRHRRALLAHHVLMNDYTSGRPLTSAERLIFTAGARDPETARRMHAFGSRMGPAPRLMARTMLRSGRVLALGGRG